MYEGIKHAHSGLRWLALIFLILAVIQAFTNKSNRTVSLWTMILIHTQVILGFVLYFFLSPITKNLDFNMKDAVQRFYGMEHVAMMVIVVILVTVGHSALKKGNQNRTKWMYLISLLVLLAGIPWPFRFDSAGWF